jgi:hypothetical protein
MVRVDLVALTTKACLPQASSEEWSRAMMVMGCDFHARYQQMAMLDEATGELTLRRLDHQTRDAS